MLPVCCVIVPLTEVSLFIERTDYRSNLAKTILFENCSCFSKIPFSVSVESPRIFQCLISIPAGHWVRQIDGDLPRRFFWSALISLVMSKIGRSERSARALRDGADVVREAIGNQFCLWICDSFLISTRRGDWDLGLCTTSVLALGERMRDGKIREKNVFRRRKNRILPWWLGLIREWTEIVHRPRFKSALHFDIRNR